MNEALLAEMLEQGYVRRQRHPSLPLEILNYSEKTAYEGVWNEVTRQCRGLIRDMHGAVVARPFPKFFNYGDPAAPDLDLEAPVIVTDKLDGSLGILYPTAWTQIGWEDWTPREWAIATRGSFTSDQATHATAVWNERYAGVWEPQRGLTYLFEILYRQNRIVVDYGATDDLFLIGVLSTETGLPAVDATWPGPAAAELPYPTLMAALEAEPRDNVEGFVIYFAATDTRLKIKQADYVALHRILTGTNARRVWEVAAVQACAPLIREEKHWGSFLGIAPARAAEVQALGDDWLADVPDEFYGWVESVIEAAQSDVAATTERAVNLASEASKLADRGARYDHARFSPLVKEVLRLANADTEARARDAMGSIVLRAWREATPAPTAPFARSEAIA